MWKEVIPIMQNWTGCADLGMEETITMKDDRDYSDNLYTVAKLKDGRCWMTQNLRIINIDISNTDSDTNSANFSIPNSNNGDWGNRGIVNVSNVYKDSSHSSEYGIYYNWYAATAGTGTPYVLSSASTASQSICPKGWGLPSRTEGQSMISKYNFSSIQNAPMKLILAGNYAHGKLYGCDYCGDSYVIGRYWTNQAADSYYAYKIQVTESSLNVSYGFYADTGVSVRCIKK